MSAQKRETKKNFIAVLSETAEEQRERMVKSEQPARRSIRSLMAAMLNRDVNGKRLAKIGPRAP
jgi:hypothetical protein